MKYFDLKKLKRDIYNMRYALLFVLIYIIFMQVKFKTVCPFLAFFKIPCPACGLTHACFYLLTGNINKSLLYNPTAIFWIISIILFVYDRYIRELRIKPFPTLFIITSIITIVFYIFRIIK